MVSLVNSIMELVHDSTEHVGEAGLALGLALFALSSYSMDCDDPDCEADHGNTVYDEMQGWIDHAVEVVDHFGLEWSLDELADDPNRRGPSH